MPVLDLLVAAAAWIVFGWLPGFVLLSALRRDASSLENAALGSLASVGAIMLVGETASLVHVPVRPWIVLPTYLLLCLAPAAAIGRPRSWMPSFARLRGDGLVVVAAVCIALAVWCLVVRSPNAVLPGTDGENHGLYAYRIEQYGTLDPVRVTTGDVLSGLPQGIYYPLALHLAAALIAASTGVPVATVLTVALVLAAGVLLPLGVYLLVRWLCPHRGAAAAAALMSVLVPWFPYEPAVWGGLTTIVGLSQVPAGVTALARPLIVRSRGRESVALALLGYGLFTEHNPELATVVVLAVILFAVQYRHLDAVRRRTRLRVWISSAALLTVALIPQIPLLTLRSAQSGAQFKESLSSSSPAGVRPFISSSEFVWLVGITLLPLAALNLIPRYRRRWRCGFGWCSLALLAIFALSFSTAMIPTLLTTPWYATPARTSYQLMLPLAIYAGAGSAMAAADVVRSSTTWTVALRWPTVVTVCALGALVSATVLPRAVSVGRSGFRDSSLIGTDQRAAFTWLRSHVMPDQRVLNDFNDGSAWMEVIAGVHPLFGARVDSTNLASWGNRGYLLTHAGALARDRRAQAAVREWDVRYVYLNGKYFDGNPRLLSPAEFSESTVYRRVWQRGDVCIFEIDLHTA